MFGSPGPGDVLQSPSRERPPLNASRVDPLFHADCLPLAAAAKANMRFDPWGMCWQYTELLGRIACDRLRGGRIFVWLSVEDFACWNRSPVVGTGRFFLFCLAVLFFLHGNCAGVDTAYVQHREPAVGPDPGQKFFTRCSIVVD